jgi:hypothetical protein
MQRRGFTIDHPLYAKLRKAELALLDFSIELHYASCRSGVGKPPASRSEKAAGRGSRAAAAQPFGAALAGA